MFCEGLLFVKTTLDIVYDDSGCLDGPTARRHNLNLGSGFRTSKKVIHHHFILLATGQKESRFIC